YADELQASAAQVARLAGVGEWRFAYQSAGATPEPWLGPEAGAVMTELAATRKNFLIVPIGFESEHVEVLYDVSVAYRGLAEQLARGATLWTGRRLEPLAEGRAAELLGIQVPTDVGGFRSFAGGMAELTEALAARLGAIIRPAQGVTGIAPTARGWRLAVTGGSLLEADGVVLAVPTWGAARLLAGLGVAA